jgi:transcriptional regulator with XRE-family HTH domain
MSTDIRARFGTRVRRLRKARGVTQVELAEYVGVGRSYLSQIERGQRDPGLRMVKALADGLGTTMSDLLQNL